MSKYREEFEQKGNIKIFVKLCMFDELINEYSSEKLHDYTLGFINGAWWAFQEQQKRIDELQVRVDAALQVIKGAARWIDEDAIDDPEFIKGGALRALKNLEQALKGGEK